MGTRNLTVVYVDGNPVIAQYGQWDGYPMGQGKEALEFCRKHLRTKAGREKFREKLSLCRWDRPGEVDSALQEIGVTNGMMNMDQVRKFDCLFPHMSRDIGAGILRRVAVATSEVVLQDNTSFSLDSLFCEFAYVVDLTQKTLEAYVGFQNTPHVGERFSSPIPNGGGYYPVKLAGSWDLGKLPALSTFNRKIMGSKG